MALFTKINTPCSTVGGVPNANNKTDELLKINALAKKTNRSNTGQVSYTSETSGTIYRTADYPNIANIYNKGETGIYNLLIRLYGGDNGFIITPDDYNNIEKELSSVSSVAKNSINETLNDINDYSKNINNQISELRNTQVALKNEYAQIIPYANKSILILRATPVTSAGTTTATFSWGNQYPNYYSKDARMLDFRFYIKGLGNNLERYGSDGVMLAPSFQDDLGRYYWKVGLYRPKIEISNQEKTSIKVTFQTIQNQTIEDEIVDIWLKSFYIVGEVYMVLQFDKKQ